MPAPNHAPTERPVPDPVAAAVTATAVATSGTAIARRPDEAPGGLLPDYRLQQRDYLLRIARAMNARLDLREVLSLVVRSAVTMTNGEAGAIAMRPLEGGEPRVVATYRVEGRFEDDLAPFLGARDAGAGEAPGARFAEAMSADAERRDPYHVVTLPLAISGDTVGRLVVFRSEGAAVFTPLDTELLEAFADQAAVAIQNASLHARLAARERLLSDLIERTPAGIALAGTDGRVIADNRAARELLGRAGGPIIGSVLADRLGLADDAGRPVPLTLPAAGATATRQGYLPSSDGGRGAFVQVALHALADPDGRLEGYVADVADLSAYKEAEDAKGAFLAGLSHELKTPLALIQGYAETLRLDEARTDPALFEESLGVILGATTHLAAMVDELLSAARLQSGAPALDFDLVDVPDLLRRVADAFARAAPGHHWAVDLPADVPPVTADPGRLRQVLDNLCANAAKYADPGTTVTLGVRVEPGGVAITVRDEGIGIAATDRQRIFDRFVRATRRGEGAGLGLYVSKAIVDAHGGRIEVTGAPGRGSTFTVFLPRDPAPDAVDRGGAGARRGDGEDAA